MAFEYENSRKALQKWIVTYVPSYFGDQTIPTVFISPPTSEGLTRYPVAVILSARTRFRDEGALIADHILDLGFITQGATTLEVAHVLDDVLQLFDSAWIDQGKTLDSSLGNWAYRRQLDVPNVAAAETEFQPIDRDEFGIFSKQVSKTIIIGEKIAARAF